MIYISSVYWFYPKTGGVDLRFENHLNGVTEVRHYRTRRGAKCAETRFHNRVERVYGQTTTDSIGPDIHFITKED